MKKKKKRKRRYRERERERKDAGTKSKRDRREEESSMCGQVGYACTSRSFVLQERRNFPRRFLEGSAQKHLDTHLRTRPPFPSLDKWRARATNRIFCSFFFFFFLFFNSKHSQPKIVAAIRQRFGNSRSSSRRTTNNRYHGNKLHKQMRNSIESRRYNLQRSHEKVKVARRWLKISQVTER